MTCIIAYIDSDGVTHMGADSFWGTSYPPTKQDHEPGLTPKIWKQEGWMIGFAGGLHFYQALQRYKDCRDLAEEENKPYYAIFSRMDEDTDDVVNTDFYGYVNIVLKNRIDQLFTRECSAHPNRDWMMYVARGGKLAVIMAGGNIRVPEMKCESSVLQADGAIKALKPMLDADSLFVEDAMRTTLTVAAETCPLVAPPFFYLDSSNNETDPEMKDAIELTDEYFATMSEKIHATN
jgi:hypothetical protein